MSWVIFYYSIMALNAFMAVLPFITGTPFNFGNVFNGFVLGLMLALRPTLAS